MRKSICFFVIGCLVIGITAYSQTLQPWYTTDGNKIYWNNGQVGIGTTVPETALHIRQATMLGSVAGNFQLAHSLEMETGNDVFQRTWLYRDGSGSDWYTSRIHNAISVDASYGTPGVDTRTWWERDPCNNIQSWGNANLTYLTINSGNIGIGTTSPAVQTHVYNNIDGTFTGLAIDNRKVYGVGSGTNELSRIILSLSEYGVTNPLSRVMGFIQAGTENETSSIHGFLAFGTRLAGTETEKMRITSAGNVGIGATAPETALHIRQATMLGSTAGNFQLAHSIEMETSNDVYQRTWLCRDGSGSDWFTARVHDAISVDVSFGTPGVDTRTWWERDPCNNIQSWGTANSTYLTINSGNVGIGTTSPNYKLEVIGDIRSSGLIKADEIQVTENGADFVFEPDYELPTLEEVESHINEHKHLPDIPSAEEMQVNGVNMGEMQTKLLQKIEELTLYVIDLKKENTELQMRVEELEKVK